MNFCTICQYKFMRMENFQSTIVHIIYLFFELEYWLRATVENMCHLFCLKLIYLSTCIHKHYERELSILMWITKIGCPFLGIPARCTEIYQNKKKLTHNRKKISLVKKVKVV